MKTAPAIREQLAKRADSARARLRRASPELGLNNLTPAQILALEEPRLAELVAVDHFGWRVTCDVPRSYETPPARAGVAYSTRPFHPCLSADDDRLALRLVRRKHRPLLGSLAEALLDLARARAGEPLHPLWVPVLAPKGDFCRGLLLIASTVWRAERAARHTTREAHHERGKEAPHEHLARGLSVTQPAGPATAGPAVSPDPVTPGPSGDSDGF